MRIVAFSDTHCHPFSMYDHYTEEGLSARLMDAVSCINQVRDYAVKVKADMVLFGGDIFHERKHLVTSAFNACFKALADFPVYGLKLYMLHGNHDQANRSGTVHAVESFEVFSTVFHRPEWYDAGNGVSICAVPYIEDMDVVKSLVQNVPDNDNIKIFLGHLGVQGAEIGADFVYRNENEPTLADLNPGAFDIGLLGHFHKHQHLGSNFWYVGATLQHNWGDVDQPRGLVDVEITDEEVTLKHVQLDYPEFLRISAADARKDPSRLEGSFVRLEADDAEFIIPKGITPRNFEIKRVDVTPDKEERIKLKESDRVEDLMEKYRDYVGTPQGLNPKELLAVGVSILQEVET